MRLNKRLQKSFSPPRLQASWLKGSAFLVFLAAVILFATVLVARSNHAQLTSYFLITVLFALYHAQLRSSPDS